MSSTPRTWFVAAFGAAIVVIAGGALVYKMTEFGMTIIKDDVSGFGVVALAVYFTGMSPLLLLTLWGMCAGHFRDIEGPKYRMLELDDAIERGVSIPPLYVGEGKEKSQQWSFQGRDRYRDRVSTSDSETDTDPTRKNAARENRHSPKAGERGRSFRERSTSP
jgi:hypothetical protein